MAKFFSKYGWSLVYLITSIFSIALIIMLFKNDTITDSVALQDIAQPTVSKAANQRSTPPTVSSSNFIVENQIIPKDTEFNYKNFITVTSSTGDNLVSYVTCREIYGRSSNEDKKVDTDGNLLDSDGNIISKVTSSSGEHELVYTLNWNGYKIEKSNIIYVPE